MTSKSENTKLHGSDGPTIDLRGLTCPQPVIRTKKFFDDPQANSVEALVDDEVCVNNLRRLARSINAACEVADRGGYYSITLDRTSDVKGAGNRISNTTQGTRTMPHSHEATGNRSALTLDDASATSTVIFLGKDTFGGGDEEFSKTLMDLFLQTTLASGFHPQAILMANSGVRLMAKDSPARKVLDDFRAAGCEVLACGLCVEYYKLKDDIAKEQITSMFAICEYLFSATKVVQP